MSHLDFSPKHETAIHKLMLNNLKELNLSELRDLFLFVSHAFVENLESCKVDELRSIQSYMRKIKDEIAARDIAGVTPNK